MKIQINNQEDLINLVEQIDNQLKENFFQRATSYWNQILKKAYKDPNLIDEERSIILLNPEYRFTVEDWLPKVEDNLLKRKLELLKQEFLRARVSSEPEVFALKNKLDYQIINFAPELNGKKFTRSELYNIIEKDDDRILREKAWKALTELGKEIECEVVLLCDLRNQKALPLGYKNYSDLCFYLENLSKEKLFDLFEQILDLTEEPYKKLIADCKEKLSIDKVSPWDIKYYQHKYLTSVSDSYFPKEEIIKSIEHLFKKFNLDMSKLPIKVEYCDIPYGGISLTLETGKDVRVLANPQEGYNWYEFLYHEFGHAIHNCFIQVPSFIIATGEPDYFKEGMACIFPKFMAEKYWLEEYLKISPEVINEFILQNKLKNCYWYRRVINDCLFEYSIYNNPEGNLNNRYKEFVTKNLFIELPDDFSWAYDPVYTTHPLYLQNYILADVIAYQTINYYKEKRGNIFSPEFLEFLKEKYYKDGGLKPWEEKLSDATGTKLKAESLIKTMENI
ncbi:MAG TPA: M3 family metallopeptidase [Candidatus Eremiobacteraeota bacterium]|nr:MAG: Peptidase family M3 [bacterium ADurb.Bin363]HPZ06837.1 M3 family metallopeptidase [Candidatus Eremiobacteraeota bacterium]